MPTKNEKKVLDSYMLRVLDSNIAESKRAEDRSDKAIQLFMGLFTALFGAIILINTNIQDPFQKYLFIGLALFIMTGFGGLTFAWLVVSNMFWQEFAMERFHLFQYFHDQDPKTFQWYGQSIYSLEPHRHFIFPKKFGNATFTTTSVAVSISLFALVVFCVLSAAIATYVTLLAFSIPNLITPLVVGLAVLIVFLIGWRISQQRIQFARLASQKLLEQNKEAG